jgi:hypothetical protein
MAHKDWVVWTEFKAGRVQDMDQWRVLVNTVISLQIPLKEFW